MKVKIVQPSPVNNFSSLPVGTYISIPNGVESAFVKIAKVKELDATSETVELVGLEHGGVYAAPSDFTSFLILEKLELSTKW